MQLYLDEAIKILHSIPDEHRMGYLDASGGLCKVAKQVIIIIFVYKN